MNNNVVAKKQVEEFTGSIFFISDTITHIADYAYENYSGLTEIQIPNSVTSIGDDAFYGCKGLTAIQISNSVTSIGVDTFQGCRRLTAISIPSSITNIGVNVFYDCPTSAIITFKCEDGQIPTRDVLTHPELAMFRKQVWFRILAGDDLFVTVFANVRIDDVENYLLRLLVVPMNVDDVRKITLVGSTALYTD